MEIQQINNETKGYFKAIEDNQEAGRMTYSWTGKDKFIIDHTEVDREFGGRGVGKKMVMKAVEYARENQLKIIPHCPFPNSVFKKTEAIRDVLALTSRDCTDKCRKIIGPILSPDTGR